MSYKYIYTLCLALSLFTISNYIQAQGTDCATATPFCSSTTVTYPAGVDNPASPSSADYGCLFTQPNAAWFFLKVDQVGLIELSLDISVPRDIDFAIWGPFPAGTIPAIACADIFSGTLAPTDCSYSGGTGVETPEITSTATGEIFVLIATNYANSPTDITISQTNGNGTTSCDFSPPPPPTPVVPAYTPVLTGTAAYSKANLEWARPIDTTGTLLPIEQFEVYITDDGGITYTLAGLTPNYSISLDLLNGIQYGFRVRPMYAILGANSYLAGNYSNLVYLRPSIVLSTEENKNAGISVYPNPSEGNFTLKFEDFVSQKATIKVTDLTGKTIFTQNLNALNGNSSQAISLPSAAAGMYILQIETDKGIYQHKISVTK